MPNSIILGSGEEKGHKSVYLKKRLAIVFKDSNIIVPRHFSSASSLPFSTVDTVSTPQARCPRDRGPIPELGKGSRLIAHRPVPGSA